MGLAGGSRCFNRVPRALLVMMDWSTAKNKPSGPISDRCWTNIFDILVISMYDMFMFYFGRFGSVLVGFQIAGWS